VTDDTDDEAGLLYGAEAIAAFLGIEVKQARHRIDEGKIPTFKIGATVCARRRTLKAWLASLEQQAEQHRARKAEPRA
jgi:hypothetical protein